MLGRTWEDFQCGGNGRYVCRRDNSPLCTPAPTASPTEENEDPPGENEDPNEVPNVAGDGDDPPVGLFIGVGIVLAVGATAVGLFVKNKSNRKTQEEDKEENMEKGEIENKKDVKGTNLDTLKKSIESNNSEVGKA